MRDIQRDMWFSIASAALPVIDAPADQVTLVFLGDSGQIPDGEDCRFGTDGSAVEPCHIDPERREQLRASIRAVEPDAVYALGDLVYWRAPACRTPEGATLDKLEGALGSLYADLGAPVYLALGNHDLAQKKRAPRRVRCLKAYADSHPDLHLPAQQYIVDHGVANVLVADTNRASRLPSDTLVQLDGEPGWLVVAAHHELRTAFDKEGMLASFEARPGRWLSELSVAPDLWANGHAHMLQFGVYDARAVDGRPSEGEPLEVAALTVGAGSKLRISPTCPGDPDCERDDPRGMPAFSISRFGFGVVVLSPERMTVSIRDHAGEELFSWSRDRVE